MERKKKKQDGGIRMQDSNNKQGGQNGVTEDDIYRTIQREEPCGYAGEEISMQRVLWIQRTQGGSLPGKSEEELAARVAAVEWRRGHQEEVKSEGLEEVSWFRTWEPSSDLWFLLSGKQGF